MTIVAGAAIFGYVNSQAGTASQAYGQQVGNSVQYLEEKFTVVDLAFGSANCGGSTCATVTIWAYNTGAIQLSLYQVRLYGVGSSGTVLNLLYNFSTIGGSSTNRIHDLLGTSPQYCGITATSYESPVLIGSAAFVAPTTQSGTIELIVPPSSAAPVGQTCPSFGLTSASASVTYYVTVVGLYGNSFTYSQVG